MILTDLKIFPFSFFFKHLFIPLNGKVVKRRDRKTSSIRWLSSQSGWSWTRPKWLELRPLSGFHTWMSGVQTMGQFFFAFPGILAGNWDRTGTGKIQTVTSHDRQQLNQLCHNASHNVLKYFYLNEGVFVFYFAKSNYHVLSQLMGMLCCVSESAVPLHN